MSARGERERLCEKCDGPTEPVGISGGGRIGWFCWECSLFHAGEGVTTTKQ